MVKNKEFGEIYFETTANRREIAFRTSYVSKCVLCEQKQLWNEVKSSARTFTQMGRKKKLLYSYISEIANWKRNWTWKARVNSWRAEKRGKGKRMKVTEAPKHSSDYIYKMKKRFISSSRLSLYRIFPSQQTRWLLRIHQVKTQAQRISSK